MHLGLPPGVLVVDLTLPELLKQALLAVRPNEILLVRFGLLAVRSILRELPARHIQQLILGRMQGIQVVAVVVQVLQAMVAQAALADFMVQVVAAAVPATAPAVSLVAQAEPVVPVL
jgi:hypothetical protein